MERKVADAPPVNPRWLVMLVAIMGVLIAVGVAVIAVEIARRMFTPAAPRTEAVGGAPAPAATWQPQIEVALPPGAKVLDSSQSGQHLHLRLQLGDGSMAVWLVDLASGRVVSRVTFSGQR